MISNYDLLSSIDIYRGEFEQFQCDVHVLIEGTLHAGIDYLDRECKNELAKIEERIEQPVLDEEYQQHLGDKHDEVLADNDSQERFLRNIALVALASRLTYALKQMATSAKWFSPPKKGKYGDKADSEFDQLWAEYKERFGLDFKTNAKRIAFIEPMRVARNQIVHEGGEAGERLSKAHPEYVHGEGIGAAVSVSGDLLNKNIEASIALVGWLAGELRKRDLSSMRQTKGVQ